MLINSLVIDTPIDFVLGKKNVLCFYDFIYFNLNAHGELKHLIIMSVNIIL